MRLDWTLVHPRYGVHSINLERAKELQTSESNRTLLPYESCLSPLLVCNVTNSIRWPESNLAILNGGTGDD